MEIKKSPKADLEKGKTLSILMGFVVGLAVLFVVHSALTPALLYS